jgi:putative SOS response-associated peptidase YedK
MAAMCGRFVQASEPEVYAEWFSAHRTVAERMPPSYNVAPTDTVYAVAEHEGERLLGSFRWGLIPFWAKDRRIAARNINARAETVATKPAFRESLTRRRCIVPADGFYEWQALDEVDGRSRGTLPHHIHRRDGGPLALAGLWATWRDPETEERVKTCTIVTTVPNDLMAPIHDRIPVVLDRPGWDVWLDGGIDDAEVLQDLLRPAPSTAMARYPVSTLVNSVANNVPECIVPLTTPIAD